MSDGEILLRLANAAEVLALSFSRMADTLEAMRESEEQASAKHAARLDDREHWREGAARPGWTWHEDPNRSES